MGATLVSAVCRPPKVLRCPQRGGALSSQAMYTPARHDHRVSAPQYFETSLSAAAPLRGQPLRRAEGGQIRVSWSTTSRSCQKWSVRHWYRKAGWWPRKATRRPRMTATTTMTKAPSRGRRQAVSRCGLPPRWTGLHLPPTRTPAPQRRSSQRNHRRSRLPPERRSGQRLSCPGRERPALAGWPADAWYCATCHSWPRRTRVTPIARSTGGRSG